jgi:hypothetical protein
MKPLPFDANSPVRRRSSEPGGAAVRDDLALRVVGLLPLTEAVMTRVKTTLSSASATTRIRAAGSRHLACAAEYGFDSIFSNDHPFLAAAPLCG